MATDIRILRQLESTSVDATGVVRPTIRVDFNVGEDGPFSVELSKSDFTAEKARAEMEKIAQQVRTVREV